MKITEHFIREEFDCKDGTPYPEEWIEKKLKPLCKALEKIRIFLGDKPIHITSGYRTESHNKRIGGANNSQHLQGLAVDISPRRVTTKDLSEAIERLIADGDIPEGGIGIYSTFVHYDHRGYRARW